jgi:hypothetical protein
MAIGLFSINYKYPGMRIQVVDRTKGLRGVQTSQFFGFYSRQSLPTDSIGNVTITFSGVKLGSEIKIFSASGVLIDGTESSSSLPSFILPKYAAGSANNTVRVLIVALAYEVLDITTVLSSSTTIPVFQRIDRTYKNPT